MEQGKGAPRTNTMYVVQVSTHRFNMVYVSHASCHASSQSDGNLSMQSYLEDMVQSVRQGKTDQAKYHKLMRKLLEDVKRRAAAGELLSSSVAGHLLNIRQALLGLNPDVSSLLEASTGTYYPQDERHAISTCTPGSKRYFSYGRDHALTPVRCCLM